MAAAKKDFYEILSVPEKATPDDIIQIEVGLFPTVGTGNDLFACDDQINGSTPTDGLSTFDLTVNTPLINLGDPIKAWAIPKR